MRFTTLFVALVATTQTANSLWFHAPPRILATTAVASTAAAAPEDNQFILSENTFQNLYFARGGADDVAEYVSPPPAAPAAAIIQVPLAPSLPMVLAFPDIQTVAFTFNIVAAGLIIYTLLKNMGVGGAGGAAGIAGGSVGEFNLERPFVSMGDWAGSPEIFEEFTDIISFFNDQEKYHAMNVEIPRGFLLEGPPGTGKTLLAKIIASSCGVNFISVSGAEFVELFVGMGARKVRALFELARENRPCIVFIDEIDAVAKKRTVKLSNNDEQEQTLNQLLYEMDGFADNEDLMIIGATNRKDMMDDAILRPGRFDRIIHVPTPDAPSREKILKLYLDQKPHDANISLARVLDLTEGLSGSHLKAIVNEAAIGTVKRNGRAISSADIERSVDKSILGITKETDSRADETRRRVAIHELGHAIVTRYYNDYFVFHKVSIQANYGGFEGFTMYNDRQNELQTKDLLTKKIMVLFGGFLAEKMFYGEEHVSTGASQDIMQANRLAKTMIESFAFGDFLITDGGGSEKIQAETDVNIHKVLRQCYDDCALILKEKRGDFDVFIPILLEKQQLTGDEWDAIVSVNKSINGTLSSFKFVL